MEPLAEARRARDVARAGAAEKGVAAQTWLGERYVQLVEAAEAIVKMSTAASEVASFVATVDERTAFVKAGPVAVALELAEPEPVEASARVVAAAPMIWRCLDNDEHAEAARMYVECSALELRDEERATLGPYVRQFKARIARSAEAFCYKIASPAKRYAEALAVRSALGEDPVALDDLFLKGRDAWLSDSHDLATAARTLRRTVIDAAQIFQGGLLEEAAREQGFQLQVPDCLEKVVEWTRNAARTVRSAAASALNKRDTTAELRSLIDRVRAECDAQSEEWTDACSVLFVEEVVSENRERLKLRDAVKVTRRDVFSAETTDALHSRLLEAATAFKRSRNDSCSLWRDVFAPSFMRVVDDRLGLGLENTRADLMTMLDAVDRASPAASGVAVERPAQELNWAGERIAHWFEGRALQLAEDATQLGQLVLVDQDTEETVRRVVKEYASPRFAEFLALTCAQLRRRAEALAKQIEDTRRRKETTSEARLGKFGTARSTGEARRFRKLAREFPMTCDSAAASLLVVARVAWVAWHSRSGLGFTVVSAHETLGDKALLLDARAVVDAEQLRAAFDIADVNGDGVVAAKEAAEAAAALMGSGGRLAAKAKTSVLLRPDVLATQAPTLTYDEFLLLAANTLDGPTRAKLPATAKKVLEKAHETALQGWARGVGGALCDDLAVDLAVEATSWLQDDRTRRGRPKDWPKGSEQLDSLLTAARWTDRVIASDDQDARETVQLPCDVTLELSTFLLRLCDQLARATCPLDLVGAASPSHAVARRELQAVIAPSLLRVYGDALDASHGSDLAPLALSVDAFFLRFAYRRAKDDPFKNSGLAVFDAVAARLDPVDLELYAPFLKADAQRSYERSSLFFDQLFGVADSNNAFDLDFASAKPSDMPPDDSLERSPNLLAAAPVPPRFPRLPEPNGNDHPQDEDDDDDPRLALGAPRLLMDKLKGAFRAAGPTN